MFVAVPFILLASVSQPPLEASLADQLALPCRWGDEVMNKSMTALTLGYVYGYAEAVDRAAAHRLRVDQPRVADRMAQLCARNPQMSLRQIATAVLNKAGIATPRDRKRR